MKNKDITITLFAFGWVSLGIGVVSRFSPSKTSAEAAEKRKQSNQFLAFGAVILSASAISHYLGKK